MAFKPHNPAAEYIDLPVADKTYRIVSPPFEVGVLIQRITEAQFKAAHGVELDAEETDALRQAQESIEGEFERLVLGDAYDVIKADRPSSQTWMLIVSTAALYASHGKEEAERFWNAGGDPKAHRKVPADRKPKSKAKKNSTG